MLPLPGNELRIGLCPDRLEIAVRRPGRTLRLQSARIVLFERDNAAPNWRAPVKSLHDALNEDEWRSARATVVLSDHFVRYVLVPWHDDVITDEERLALAQHTFRSVYGETVSDWTVRLDTTEYGASAVASAIDSALLDELRAVFKDKRPRLVSIQPHFVAAFNQFRAAFGDSGNFIVVEPERLCLGSFRGDRWQGVNAYRCNPDAALDVALAQALAADPEAAAADTFIYARAGVSTAAITGFGGAIKPLELPLPQDVQSGVEVALCGAV